MTGIWDATDPLAMIGGQCVACERPRMARYQYCALCLRRNLPDMGDLGVMLSARLVHDMVEDLMRTADKPVAVYRYFDADGRLLYVGISNRPEARRAQHIENSKWYRFVATWSVEWYDDRSIAAHHELDAIDVEQPIFNRAGADAGRAERARVYLLEHVAIDLLASGI